MGFQKASHAKRLGAALIDCILAVIIMNVLSMATGSQLLGWLVYVAAMLLRDANEGKSPGKMLFDLQVVTDAGAPAQPIDSAKRNITMVIPLVPLIELVVYFTNAEGKRLGDQFAKTRVVDLKTSA